MGIRVKTVIEASCLPIRLECCHFQSRCIVFAVGVISTFLDVYAYLVLAADAG